MKPKKKTPKKARKPHKSKRALLLGLGLDNQDGHVRVTQGENFHLVGGSKETHELMQEKAVKFGEELRRRGKALEQISRQEFRDIADKVRLNRP